MSKNTERVKFNYWPVTVLAKVLIVASAAAVDADIVVELIVDDAVAVDDETAIDKKKRRNNKNGTNVMEFSLSWKFRILFVISFASHKQFDTMKIGVFILLT